MERVHDMVFDYQDRQIKICTQVLDTIAKYRQSDSGDSEAGGVLIGRENISNDNLIIEFATEPMPGDKRHRHRFYRKDKGHINFYQNLYNNDCGIYAYVGEWHTHPEAFPSYSRIDSANWKRIGENAGFDSTQIHIIAGYSALRLWMYSCSKSIAKELVTIKWENM